MISMIKILSKLLFHSLAITIYWQEKKIHLKIKINSKKIINKFKQFLMHVQNILVLEMEVEQQTNHQAIQI